MKKRIIITICCILICLLSACERNNSINYKGELKTKTSYKINDQINIGINSNIIKASGKINESINMNFLSPLQVDNYNNIICYNKSTNLIEKYNMDTGILIEKWDFMNGHQNKLYAINMHENIIAWTECPHADIMPIYDDSHGKGWELYYADYNKKKVVRADGDNGINLPNSHIEYGYLAPSYIDISSEYLSYIAFDYGEDGEITATIRLYKIDGNKIEIIDYLNEDLSNHAYGYPRIYNDKVVWCKARVNKNGTYEGVSFLYDIESKDKYKLGTEENIINPYINNKYIVAEGKPNKTYYDGEICIYDIDSNMWEYKLNGLWSEYKKMNNNALSIKNISDKYLLWDTSLPRTLCIYNFDDSMIYKIVTFDENKLINYKKLMNDVIVYSDTDYYGDLNNVSWNYVRLK